MQTVHKWADIPLRSSLNAEMYAESSIHALSKAPRALESLAGGGLIVETSAVPS